MVNEGLTYQKIAKMRGVSDSYIRELMSIIGKRLKVKGKANILLKLSS
jgi:DNA-binding CsgD family transcriptional regulator